jgi:hypothetical protein
VRLIVHQATIGGTADEWEAIRAHLALRGRTRLSWAIEQGVRRNEARARWDGHDLVRGGEVLLLLRFRGGSIKKIADAIAAIGNEGA